MSWVYNDGGRARAGRKGDAGDCVTRAIAIAAELPYPEVYKALNDYCREERFVRGRIGRAWAVGRGSSARTGIHKRTYEAYLRELGWSWTPTMRVGSGCKVHLCADELPSGRLIVSVSKHLVAVVDGVIHDTHDPAREGTRCVYGYWSKA